jgi:hypothetical protein
MISITKNIIPHDEEHYRDYTYDPLHGQNNKLSVETLKKVLAPLDPTYSIKRDCNGYTTLEIVFDTDNHEEILSAVGRGSDERDEMSETVRNHKLQQNIALSLKEKTDQISALLKGAVLKEIDQDGIILVTPDGKEVNIWTEEYDGTLIVDGIRLEP